MRVEAARSQGEGACEEEGQALLDSGASHAVIPFSKHSEKTSLSEVPVTLAGDSKQTWFKTDGGTLVVPR